MSRQVVERIQFILLVVGVLGCLSILGAVGSSDLDVLGLKAVVLRSLVGFLLIGLSVGGNQLVKVIYVRTNQVRTQRVQQARRNQVKVQRAA